MQFDAANERMELPGDKFHHLTLMYAPQGSLSVSLAKCRNLRTLTTFRSKITTIGPQLLEQLRSIRTLILSNNSIKELPKEIGGLIHLRYLDLSHNCPL